MLYGNPSLGVSVKHADFKPAVILLRRREAMEGTILAAGFRLCRSSPDNLLSFGLCASLGSTTKVYA